MSNPNTGHRILHVSYAVEQFICTCGETITAEPDPDNHDRHLPLVEKWAEHKRASGVITRRGGRDYAKVTA